METNQLTSIPRKKPIGLIAIIIILLITNFATASYFIYFKKIINKEVCAIDLARQKWDKASQPANHSAGNFLSSATGTDFMD
jgi:hypothetical protein